MPVRRRADPHMGPEGVPIVARGIGSGHGDSDHDETAMPADAIRSLKLSNLTAFAHVRLEFAEGLNLIAGENGTGKTHLLKVCYSILEACTSIDRAKSSTSPTKGELSKSLAAKLAGVFMPDQLGRLVRRRPGRNRCEVECRIGRLGTLDFSFNTSSKTEVSIEKIPSRWLTTRPVYLPPRELLTIAPGFVSLYDTTHIGFEETYRDTCLLLGVPLAKGPREAATRELLAPIEEAMGGYVETDTAGRFYLRTKAGQIEMHLVAEGLRKLAMLARLIATGQLVGKGFLFWDEPEANLNPKVIKGVARTVLHLCRSGIQVFVATHSLFLMRELDILLRTAEFAETPRRFFGLHPTEAGVEVQQGESIDDIGEITSLQEELSQSDRYLAAETG